MTTTIFGNENLGQGQIPFVLNFAQQQAQTPSGAAQLPYNAKLQMSEFSMQENKVWNAQKTCTIQSPSGNERVWDYDVPD